MNPILSTIAIHAIPRADLQATHRNLCKSSDLFAHGYSISHWIDVSALALAVRRSEQAPVGVEVLEYNPRTSRNPRPTATTRAEQDATREALGAIVPAWQMGLFEEVV